jgi:hypothetical protein
MSRGLFHCHLACGVTFARSTRVLRSAKWSCLCLALALTALTPLSCWNGLSCWGTLLDRRLVLSVDQGSLFVHTQQGPVAPGYQAWDSGLFSVRNPPRYHLWDWAAPWRKQGGNTYTLGVPTWFAVAVAGLLAALLWRLESRSRRRAGLCTSCGYDRRGLVGGDAACPECGSKP